MSEPQGPSFGTITVRELAERLANGAAPRIIDIREPHEWSLARLTVAELMPLSDVCQWWRSLDPAEELVFHCHHGVRSAALCRVLAAQGFTRSATLAGGIEAWSIEIDPGVPLY